MGPQSGLPQLGLLSAVIGPHQQEVIPVYGHLRAGCFNSPIYSSSLASMQGHQVPIGGGGQKTPPVVESNKNTILLNSPVSNTPPSALLLF